MNEFQTLVVEDQTLVALELCGILRDTIGDNILVASSVSEALNHLDSDVVDLALLDTRLPDGTSFAIADILRAKDIPYVFVTAYSRSDIPVEHRTAPFVAKPFLVTDIYVGMMQAVMFTHSSARRRSH